MEKICYLVLAGEPIKLDFAPKDGDLVIAVDGGLTQLARAGIKPQLIVGDFDSLGYTPPGGEVVKLDSIKDMSDTFAALGEGMSRGYTHFRLYCALGGRLSHTLSNISAMKFLHDNGCHGELFGDGIRAFTCSTRAEVPESGYMSVLPLTDSATVKITDCKYSGTFTMTRADSLGISNEPNKNAAVTVTSGVVLIILEKLVL